MEFDLSNMTIPIATLLGASWLFTKGSKYGLLILLIGLGWWGVDQKIKWRKMKYVVENGG